MKIKLPIPKLVFINEKDITDFHKRYQQIVPVVCIYHLLFFQTVLFQDTHEHYLSIHENCHMMDTTRRLRCQLLLLEVLKIEESVAIQNEKKNGISVELTIQQYTIPTFHLYPHN